MSCDHKTAQEFAHCNRVALFERVAIDAKALLEARKKLMAVLGGGAPWDAQQEVVQTAVKRLEANIEDADIAGLFR